MNDVVIVDGDATLLNNVDGEAQNILEIAKVTGVKGENETDYRWGDVNLTRENIGVLNIEQIDIDTVTGE